MEAQGSLVKRAKGGGLAQESCSTSGHCLSDSGENRVRPYIAAGRPDEDEIRILCVSRADMESSLRSHINRVLAGLSNLGRLEVKMMDGIRRAARACSFPALVEDGSADDKHLSHAIVGGGRAMIVNDAEMREVLDDTNWGHNRAGLEGGYAVRKYHLDCIPWRMTRQGVHDIRIGRQIVSSNGIDNEAG